MRGAHVPKPGRSAFMDSYGSLYGYGAVSSKIAFWT